MDEKAWYQLGMLSEGLLLIEISGPYWAIQRGFLCVGEEKSAMHTNMENHMETWLYGGNWD